MQDWKRQKDKNDNKKNIIITEIHTPFLLDICTNRLTNKLKHKHIGTKTYTFTDADEMWQIGGDEEYHKKMLGKINLKSNKKMWGEPILKKAMPK